MDVISRQDAIDALKNERSDWNCDYNVPVDHCFDAIYSVPSAQPERKKGKWTKDCACEICGFKPWYERDIHTLSFCPNCGADMREDQDG